MIVHIMHTFISCVSEKNDIYVQNSDSEDSDYHQEDAYLKRITEKGRTRIMYNDLYMICWCMLVVLNSELVTKILHPSPISLLWMKLMRP